MPHKRLLAILLGAMVLAGCRTAPVQAPVAEPLVCPAPPPPPLPVPVAAPALPCPPSAANLVLEHADRLRAMSVPELAQEISRIGETVDTPARQIRLAIALGLTKVPSDAARAQTLLQRVLAQLDPDSRLLHSLARLLLAQNAEQRRADEQLERQGQQLRDAQRRVDQLNERLEAVRAIERSLPAQPASAPASGQRPAPPP